MENVTDSQLNELLDEVKALIKSSKDVKEAKEKVNKFINNFSKK